MFIYHTGIYGYGISYRTALYIQIRTNHAVLNASRPDKFIPSTLLSPANHAEQSCFVRHLLQAWCLMWPLCSLLGLIIHVGTLLTTYADGRSPTRHIHYRQRRNSATGPPPATGALSQHTPGGMLGACWNPYLLQQLNSCDEPSALHSSPGTFTKMIFSSVLPILRHRANVIFLKLERRLSRLPPVPEPMTFE